MAMLRAAAARVAPGRTTLPENLRIWTCAYLLVSIPLSVFLYLNAFQEAASFFGGISGSWLGRWPYLPLLFVSILGGCVLWRLPLVRREWWVTCWILVAAASALLQDYPRQWRQTTALAVCIPLWISLPSRWAILCRHSTGPLGSTGAWVRNGLVIVAAVILSFVVNTLWICRTFPEFHADWRQTVFLAGRVATLAGAPALLAIPALALSASCFRRTRHGTRLMLALLGTGFVVLIGLILFNGLSILDPALVRPANFVFALALALPVSIFFCERISRAGGTLAGGLACFAQIRFLRRARHRWQSSVPLIALLLFILVQSQISRAHRYYEWGFGTSLLYCSISIGCTWALLTALRPRLQFWVGCSSLALALIGTVTLLPLFQQETVWMHYTKFDNNIASLVRAYFRRHPRAEPEFQRARQLLDAAYALMPTNLIALRQQQLIPIPVIEKPYIFFIVADALRADTYNDHPADGRKGLPGIAWMAQRFVAYDNAWSSYNSTLGSYPAYLSGVMNPAWYQFTSDWPIQQDNLIARAAQQAHYCAYNLATFDDELARLWPTSTAVPLGDAGRGQGDPAVVFPRALDLLEHHRGKRPQQPGLFYLHLYNLHQPLLPRPGVPLDDQGRHWMRALYEQNAAYFDLHLKRFLEALEQQRVLDHSLVIVTGDHGEEVFDLGGLYHGWQINPFVMRVPLYVHYPKWLTNAPAAGTTSPRPVNLIDLAPTIGQTMGLSIRQDSAWQGVSLLAPEPDKARSFLLLSWESPIVGRVTFSPPQMLVLNLESGQEEAFVPSGKRWIMARAPMRPTALAESITEDLRELFRYWHMDVITGNR